MELIKVFRARVIDVAPQSLILEVSGTVDKIDGLLEVLRPFGVLEMVRVGPHRFMTRETAICCSRHPSLPQMAQRLRLNGAHRKN